MEKQLKGIGGWLAVFVVGFLGFGGVLGNIATAIAFLNADSAYAALDASIRGSLACLAIVALVLMLQKNPKGLLWARILLGANVIVGLLLLIPPSNIDGVKYVLGSIIWVVYLSMSKRVKNTYGTQIATIPAEAATNGVR